MATLLSSMAISLFLSLSTVAMMFLLRPTFRHRPETTFLGGFVGAILLFFLLIFVGNAAALFGKKSLGWILIGFCEILALFASILIHPVCAITCFVFSIPALIYVKWAATKIALQARIVGESKKTD
jgi:hypothetical protein